MEEEWREVVGFHDYEVSNLGRVRSKDRFIEMANSLCGSFLRKHKGRAIKARLDKDGYHVVNLYIDKKMYTMKVHALVAEAFIEPRPEGMAVRHYDGNKSNNVPKNLLWGTEYDNAQDRKRHGRYGGIYSGAGKPKGKCRSL